MFHVEINLNDKKDIPKNHIQSVPIDEFKLPPGGTSLEEEFDLLAHIELEPEIEEKKDEDEEEEEEEEKVEEDEQKFKSIVPQIQNFWLKMTPSEDDFIDEVVNSFEMGLDQIKVFERWGKHNELSPYSDALEEWDDIVGESWDEPDQLALDPFQWINENEFYTDKKEKVKESIESAFDKAKVFLTRFQPLLEVYWRNNQVDLNILVHERLKNPVDTLSHTIKLFNFYHNLFNSKLPSHTELGMLSLDSKNCRTSLLPTPKKFIAQIEDLVPKIMKARSDQAKKWLQQCLRDLQKQVETVEDFVE